MKQKDKYKGRHVSGVNIHCQQRKINRAKLLKMRAFQVFQFISCLSAVAVPALAYNTTAPEGLTITDTFTLDGMSWTVYEDLLEPGGDIVMVPETGSTKRFATRLEATKTGADSTVPLFMGMNPAEVNQAPNDLLADALLKDGEPDEAAVRDVLPFPSIAGWDTFLGNIQANDTLIVRADARTWNYFPLDFQEKDILGNPEYNNWTYDGQALARSSATDTTARTGPNPSPLLMSTLTSPLSFMISTGPPLWSTGE